MHSLHFTIDKTPLEQAWLGGIESFVGTTIQFLIKTVRTKTNRENQEQKDVPMKPKNEVGKTYKTQNKAMYQRISIEY